MKKLEELAKAGNGGRESLDAGGELVPFMLPAGSEGTSSSSLVEVFQQISSLERLQTQKLNAKLDRTKKFLEEARREEERARERREAEFKAKEAFVKEMQQKSAERAESTLKSIQAVLNSHISMADGQVQSLTVDLKEKREYLETIEKQLGAAAANRAEAKEVLEDIQKNVGDSMKALRAEREKMVNQRESAMNLTELFAEKIGVTKLGDILNGVENYGRARFERRTALLKDELMLERLADYGMMIASGLENPVVSEYTANAYPLQIARYFKISKGVAAVVGNSVRFFDDFKIITDSLLDDLKLDDVQKKDALDWICGVCPAGLATLWDACLQKMLKVSKEQGYEKQQEVKNEMVDKLREYIHTLPNVGDAARKIVNNMEKRKRKKKMLKKDTEKLEEEMEDASAAEKKDLKAEIKDKKQEMLDVEEELQDLENDMMEASGGFQFAVEAFDNILERLFKVSVEVEVQLRIGGVVSNVCGPVMKQLMPLMVSFQYGHQKLQKQFLEAPPAGLEASLKKKPDNMDKLKALEDEIMMVD